MQICSSFAGDIHVRDWVFFLPILWGRCCSDHTQEDLAKFGWHVRDPVTTHHPPSVNPPRKKDGPSWVHVEASHWGRGHQHSIPKFVHHHFWLGLIALSKMVGINVGWISFFYNCWFWFLKCFSRIRLA